MPDGVSEVRVSIAPLGEIVLKQDRLLILDAAGECWSELPVKLPTSKPFKVSLFVENNIVEPFVHDRYSLAARLPSHTGPVRLSSQAPAVTSMRVSEWRK